MVDSGAAVIVMLKQLLGFPNIHKLEPTRTMLRTYLGQTLNACGVVYVDVKSNHKEWTLPLVVISRDMLPLLGKNWLPSQDEAWTALCVNTVKVVLSIGGITVEWDDVFKKELGCSKV